MFKEDAIVMMIWGLTTCSDLKVKTVWLHLVVSIRLVPCIAV